LQAPARTAPEGLRAAARDGVYPGLTRETQGRWQGPFFFIQLADTQFGMFNSDRSWEKETENFTRAVEQINRLKPRFVIVCGDLVNQAPGGKVRAEQVREFQRIAGTIDPSIPLVCVSGNHDVGNRPTASSLAAYRADFGDDRFLFWAGGVAGLVVNSSLYYDPAGAPEEQAAQEAWLEKELAAAKAANPKHLLLFQHHSWFVQKADEPDQYFNIPRARRDPALALLHRAGVRAVFAGHYHRNAHGRDGDLEMVTNGPVGKPLGKDPSGLRIVKVYEDRIEHDYYPLDAVPEKVELR
ncbi:MAG TPA: metallophosphoesterase, partial [Armatimonadota bacterium]|nr:metallophosphoesterase [Armatimonadota bacterium]